MGKRFDQFIKIIVDNKSLTELESDIKDINKEIEEIRKNEIKVNQTLKEKTEILKKIEDLENVKNALIKEQNKLEEKGLTNSEKAQKRAEEAQEKTIKNYEKRQQKAEQLFKISEGLTGAFQAGESASLLFGEQTSEALSKAQARVIALQGATDGIKKIAEGASNAYKLIGSNITKATKASSLFGSITKAALISTGIGALVVLLGLIITNFDKISDTVEKTFKNTFIGTFIDNVKDLIKRVGSLDGLFTVLKGNVLGFFKGITALFKGEGLDKALKIFKEEQEKALVKAETDNARNREIKAKELAIKISKNEIDILKAKGKDVFKEEAEVLKKTDELLKLKLVGLKKGSEEEIKIQDELSANKVAIEANAYAESQKMFEKQFKRVDENANRQKTQLTKNLEKKKITEEQYALKSIDIEEKALNERIVITKKKGDDLTALLLQRAELDLKRQQLIEEQRKTLLEKQAEKRAELIEKEYQQALISAENGRSNNISSEYEYQKELEVIERDFLLRRLKNEKEGSKEQLAIKKQLADLDLKEQKAYEEKYIALVQYYDQKEIDADVNIVNNQKKSISERLDAEDRVFANLQNNLEKRLNLAKFNFGEESLEYKKLTDEKTKLETDHANAVNNLNKQRIQNTITQAQQVAGLLAEANNIANQYTQQQIEESNKNIESIQANQEKISNLIEENQNKIDESRSRSQKIEEDIANSRGARFESLKQQLEQERIQRQETQKVVDYLNKKKAEEQKRVEAEQKKIAELQKQQKQREKTLAITNAIINTASGVVNALGTYAPPVSFIFAAAVAALGAAQIGIISNAKYEKGGLLRGKSHSEGGMMVEGTNIELEGNEFVVNKKSTMKYLPLLQKINNEGNSLYADGGQVPDFNTVNNATQSTNKLITEESNRTYVVSVTDINRGQERVKVIQSGSGY